MTKTEIFFEVLNVKLIDNLEYIKNKNFVINNVVINSKDVLPNDLFIAIRGGNNYVKEALEKGAYVVYDCSEVLIDDKYIDKSFLVEDSILFLQKFAKKWRESLNAKVIGITGSNGKTTVKDMLFHLLSQKYKGKKTEGNLNNHIGLPFTLLRLEKDDEFIILEMGMSGFNEIDLLGDISKPDISIITNIGESHLEYLHSKENVFLAKSEIISHTKNTLVLNGDDDYLKNIDKLNNVNVIKVFNEDKKIINKEDKNFYYSNVSYDENGSKFDFKYFGRRCENFVERTFSTNVIGKHNIFNLSIAIAVSKILFLEDKYIIESINKILLTNMRFELIEKGNIIYINDAYNASPMSMKRSLETFSNLYKNRIKIAVLGDMLELGENELKYHEDIAKILEKICIDKVYLYGTRMYSLYKKIYSSTSIKEIKYFEDKKLIIDEIEKQEERLAILVKASRGMKLEEIIK